MKELVCVKKEILPFKLTAKRSVTTLKLCNKTYLKENEKKYWKMLAKYAEVMVNSLKKERLR